MGGFGNCPGGLKPPTPLIWSLEYFLGGSRNKKGFLFFCVKIAKNVVAANENVRFLPALVNPTGRSP